MNARYAAVLALQSVIQQNRSLNTVLPELFQSSPQLNRSLAQEIIYGTLRYYWTLDFYLSQLLEKPLKSKDEDVRILLLIGIYQLRYLKIAEHAVVNETVKTAAELGKTWAKSLINAILRSYIRKESNLEKRTTGNITAVYSHPLWMIEMLKSDWPNQFRDILKANNSRAPMSIRVNALKNSRSDYLGLLSQKDLNAFPVDALPFAIELREPIDVNALPGFSEGWVSVQDCAAQFAAELLDLRPGLCVLDACCAPGGKTAAILEKQSDLNEVVALDIDEQRINRTNENLARLQLNATLKCADAANVYSWWDNRLFDRVLLDAPCSGTGVIRRNPDIKHLRKESDIANLASRQRQLLEACWQVLAPGGILLYATCSVLKVENEIQIDQFLSQHNDACCDSLVLDWGEARARGRQILPGDHNADGFFYARMRKIEASA